MNDYSSIMTKSGDVYTVINESHKIAWSAIKESSINRILYITSVMYSFIEPQKENVFRDEYNFVVTLSGPEDAEVENALINLESNHFIEQNENGFSVLIEDSYESFENIPSMKVRRTWIEDIIYIIGVYGEDKIYDFIFRDPQYNTTFKSNSINSLDIGKDNETVKFLISFKAAFEEKLNGNIGVIETRKYLEMYFEYVFGKILRGE